VGAGKGEETIKGSNNSRNNKLTGKCMHCHKQNYEEYKSYRKKVDEMAATKKRQDGTKYTANATAMVTIKGKKC
jgi:hypothetical protein